VIAQAPHVGRSVLKDHEPIQSRVPAAPYQRPPCILSSMTPVDFNTAAA